MKGMTLKTFPYKFTCGIGCMFLGTLLWHSITRSGISFLLMGIFSVFFLGYAISTLISALMVWSKMNWLRALLSGLYLGLAIPFLYLGGFLSNQIFLWELPQYQAVTDLMVQQEKTKAAVFRTRVELPPGYEYLFVSPKASIECDENNIVTVLYTTNDSSAVGHAGSLYRSDDDPAPLKNEHSTFGYVRLAPCWYLWGA
jgi:hypothetical protein